MPTADRKACVLVLILASCILTAMAAPVAGQGTLFVEGDSVGIGTPTPQNILHIKRSDGTAKILVEETGPVQSRTLFEMKNNGGVQYFYTNTADNLTWQASAFSSSFQFSLIGTNTARFRILNSGAIKALRGSTTLMDLGATGNLLIAGTLTEGSSRSLKNRFEAVDPKTILDQVAALPVTRWTYKGQKAPHLGPVAEDFYESFGLGEDNQHIAPKDIAGVALVATQGLYAELQTANSENLELRNRVSELEAESQELRSRLEALEKALTAER